MQISDKTLYTDVVYNAIKAEDKERIKELATTHLLGCNIWDIELGILLQFINGDFSVTKVDANAHEAGGVTIFVKFFFEQVADFISEFAEKYKNLTPAPNNDERLASRGCLEISFSENLLYFTRSYFGLHSFADCEKIKVAEILIAKKDVYNSTIFQRNFAEIEKQKLKSRKK